MSSQDRVLLFQRLIAMPFLILGAWCLIAPSSVERLVIKPEFQHLSTTSAILMGCFGAQAILAGLFVLLSRFTRWTFFGFGLALLPFFVFNYYFLFVLPVFTYWMALDFVANAIMLALCIAGWRTAQE